MTYNILKPFTAVFFISMVFISCHVFFQVFTKKKLHDRLLFWIFGLSLVLFTATFPPEISRDGVAYIRDVLPNICGFSSCDPLAHKFKDIFWYVSVRFLGFIVPPERSIFVLASIGVLIKLFVFDKICKNRLLALLIYVPLVYIQYDFTQLRAGFAISWYFVGFYLFSRHKYVGSAAIVSSSFLWHAQALPSILLYPFYLINRSRIIFVSTILLLIILIYSGCHPSVEIIKKMQIGIGSERYINSTLSGLYNDKKDIPYGYLFIIFSSIAIVLFKAKLTKLDCLSGSSILLALFLSWFFYINPVIQGRLFEFYAAPLIFLIANVCKNLHVIFAIFISFVLYMRLEILHDWILG